MVIKVCGRHGYREQGDEISELECPVCEEVCKSVERDENPFEELETL